MMAGSSSGGRPPLVLALGGTVRPNSTSEKILRLCAEQIKELGADVAVIPGPGLVMPMYDPSNSTRCVSAIRMVELMRRADAFIIASPGYHGSVSGLVKNALDYTEDLREDERPYFDGCKVGCIAVSNGWQAAAATLGALRDIAHALRGWPTPIGIAANSTELEFEANGSCGNEALMRQVGIMAAQVVERPQYRRGKTLDLRVTA